MTKETTIEQALVKAVKDKGGLCFKLTGYKGIPDRLILLPGGKARFIEVKAPGEEPRKDQLAAHKSLRKLGFEVWVLDDIDFVDFVLEATYE